MTRGDDRNLALLVEQKTEIETLMLFEQGPAMGQGQGMAHARGAPFRQAVIGPVDKPL